MSTNPFYDERIVSFADILGFSDRVCMENDTDLPEIIKMILSFRSAFDENLNKDHPSRKKIEDDIFLPFSDGFLRGRSNEYAPLFYEIIGFVHGIMETIWSGHLVRGSVSHGKIYYDEKSDVLVSPAFIRAYELEQKQAVYPRVIIDPLTLKEFPNRKAWRNNGHPFDEESEYVYECLRLDFDGYYFIDYLKAAYEECETPDTYALLVEKHKNIIETRMSKADSNSNNKLKQKIIWLGNYHNQVLSEHGHLEELKIAGDLLKI